MITDIDFDSVKVCGIEVKRNAAVNTGDWERFWHSRGSFSQPIGQDIIRYVDMDSVDVCGNIIRRPTTISSGNWFVFWVEKYEVGLRYKAGSIYG